MVALLLLVGCDGGGSDGFESSLLSTERPANELTGAEAELLCNEAVEYADAAHDGEPAWVAAYCHRVGLGDGVDADTCEAAEASCLEGIEMPFYYYWNYGASCGSLANDVPSGCSVTVADIENCVTELRMALRDSAALPCSEASADYSLFETHMSPGCAVLVDRSSPCSALLGNGRP